MEFRSVKRGDIEAVAPGARPVDLRGGANGTDAALVVAAKTGDARAFGELYERYRDAIYRFCLARTGTSHDAEDLTSDVFMKALQSIDRYQERGLPFGVSLSDRAQRRDRSLAHAEAAALRRRAPAGAGVEAERRARGRVRGREVDPPRGARQAEVGAPRRHRDALHRGLRRG